MLEKIIESYLRFRVEAYDGLCLKWVCPNRRGVPDRIVFINRQVWFVELKRPTGKRSKLQELFEKELVARLFINNYIVISSKEEVDNFIRSVTCNK